MKKGKKFTSEFRSGHFETNEEMVDWAWCYVTGIGWEIFTT